MDIQEEAKSAAEQYRNVISVNEKIKALKKKVRDGTADIEDATEYASLTGKSLGDILTGQIMVLFPEKITYEEARELIGPVTRENYQSVANYVKAVIRGINQADGLGIAALVSGYPENRVEGLAKALENMTVVSKEIMKLWQSFETLSMSTVDDSVRKNIDFRNKLGFEVSVIREFHPEETIQSKHHGKGMWECPWCKSVAGVYNYEDVKDTGNDVWRRHNGCHCVITYKSSEKTDVIYNGMRARAPDNNTSRR